jgi:hypothetical protein
MKVSILILFFMSSFFVFGQKLSEDNNYFKMYEAAKQAKENNSGGLRTLYKMSLEDFGDPKINKILIKSTLLGMIRGGSKAIRPYTLAVDSKFIALESMAFLGQAPFQVKCTRCTGLGFTQLRCKDCFKGVCKNCRGKKQLVYKGLGGEVVVRKCVTCKATGSCIGCNATGTVPKKCWTCAEKGTVFSKRATIPEYVKSLQHIISYIPTYAAGKGIFITDEVVTMAEQNLLKKELEEAQRIEALAREKELAAMQVARAAARAKRDARQKELQATSGQVIQRSPREENLAHVLLEFNQFFRNRERIQKQSVYESAVATYEKGIPTLHIVVTPAVGGLAKDMKLQYLEAFYNFWKLRCTSNRLGNKVGYIANYRKKDIATVQDDKVVLN